MDNGRREGQPQAGQVDDGHTHLTTCLHTPNSKRAGMPWQMTSYSASHLSHIFIQGGQGTPSLRKTGAGASGMGTWEEN